MRHVGSELSLKDIFYWVAGISMGCWSDPILGSNSMRATHRRVTFISQKIQIKKKKST